MRISDWSSDVCSSELVHRTFHGLFRRDREGSSSDRHGFRLIPISPGESRRRTEIQSSFPRRGTAFRKSLRSIGKGKTIVELRSLAITLRVERRSDEHTSELKSLMRTSYAVFWL